ncbi:DNA phosphorothioation-dependent restriction protein DptF [Brochothrix campestris]|uniref:DNA phosphorothioation-dependent restriction protein DptF n=1 Tax=Brochothrix campestris FSL F6-1037 TaxID=1265861 RepID=W7CJ11_9LIST|nr:DNA phosphorothioation-dependent restriction protein DptF [Brochothrix campestris]EUJ39344.1 hypothetical protein BCAMP_07375 [Brochothrix campestris FSL F6-1037]
MKHIQKRSHFIEAFTSLKISSQEAVIDGNSGLSADKNYYHVKRPVETELIERLQHVQQQLKPQVVFLCGNVGDGKSHLLSYLKSVHPELLKNVRVHNDATESFSPQETALDTLKKLLADFKDNPTLSHAEPQHLLIAINMGVLHKLISDEEVMAEYATLCQFIHESNLFNDQKIGGIKSHQHLHIVNLLEHQLYTIKEGKLTSTFFEQLLVKITQPTDDNLLYQAWLRDKNNGIKEIAHRNYQLLMDKTIQRNVIDVLLEAIFKGKLILSVRSFLDFINGIVIPDTSQAEPTIDDCFPQLIFNQTGKTKLLDALYNLDPAKQRTLEYDQVLKNFMVDTNFDEMIARYIENDQMIDCFWKNEAKIKENISQSLGFLIRSVSLSKQRPTETSFKRFITMLYGCLTGKGDVANELVTLINNVQTTLYSEGFGQLVFDYRQKAKFAIGFDMSQFEVKDLHLFGAFSNETEITNFSTTIKIDYGYKENENRQSLEIDYALYDFLSQVVTGYRPNRQALNKMTKYTDFIHQMIDNYPLTHNVFILNKETGYLVEMNEQKALFATDKNATQMTAKEYKR